MARKSNIDELKSRQHAYSIETKSKQTRLGITSYRWSSANDERTCEHCKANHGKTFLWSDPPPTGHPGEGKCCSPDEGCRCVAIPIINLD